MVKLKALHFLLFVIIMSAILQAQTSATLNNDAVVQMAKWKLADADIIATINRNDSVNFDLSPATISTLKDAGISDAVIDAMYAAAKKASAVKVAPVGKPTSGGSGKSIQAHTPERLAAAKLIKAETGTIPTLTVSCPVGNNGKIPKRTISLFWPSGTTDPTKIYESGPTCFEVRDFNNVLYTASFSLTETAPSGSALDLLKDAISTVTGFSFGSKTNNPAADAANDAAKKNKAGAIPINCPTTLTDSITIAQARAGNFSDMIGKLDPGKDGNGKVNLVDWPTTVSLWQPVPDAYNQFQAATSQVINNLSLEHVDACSTDVLASAEAVILDAYVPARQSFTYYQARVNSAHVIYFAASVNSTSDYKATVQANYPAGSVAGGAKDFLIPAGHKILSSSGGFLITELPGRSYSSVTVPSGMTSPATQNVLGINDYNGPRVGVAALLNVYLPKVFGLPMNRENWGLALSAGPTYAVSGNSTDSSQWGLLVGPSLHIRNQLLLTPGINVGEFADYPIGYTHSGQVIPPNTGTPVPVKRPTARFGFSITYKIKDFGQTTGQTNQSAVPVAPTPKPAGTDAGSPASKKQ
ncbi:hypothetical protein [Tunturiibacter gelidiferens]|uniref:hypothetical protein n=1 Tax=Tunturiibacter gelidiferens TaxID=3069689 RepID=UPI003D9B39A3